LDKQNEEYQIKINKLEKYIKELELKLKEKDIIINEEIIKNDNLNKRIKELENISNNNDKKNDIKELENEIKLFKSYCKFSGEDKLISIKFISVDQEINFNIVAKNTDIFSKLETMLYEKYPKYVDSVNFFLVNGNRINNHRSLKDNKIKNNDVITLQIQDFD